MAVHEYMVGSPSSRELVLTPTDSDDGSSAAHYPRRAEKPRSLYRMFDFRKTGPQWKDGAKLSESSLSETEIKTRIEKPSRTKPSISERIDSMSEGRRDALDRMMTHLYATGSPEDDWTIVAIKDSIVQVPNKQADVRAFSVIVRRVASSKPRSKSYVSDGSKRGSFVSSGSRGSFVQAEHASAAERRKSRVSTAYDYGSAALGTSSQSPPSSGSGRRQSRGYSQSIIEDDPFAVTPIFTQQGKPLDLLSNTAYGKHDLPPPIPRAPPNEALFDGVKGKKSNKRGVKSKTKSGSKALVDTLGDLGIETQFANTDLAEEHDFVDDRYVSDALGEASMVLASSEEDSQEADIIEVSKIPHKKKTGRDKRRDSGYAQTVARLKSRPQIALDIPATAGRHQHASVLQPFNSRSRRRSGVDYIPATPREEYSVPLDYPPPEIEYIYGSSDSSADHYLPLYDDQRILYTQSDGRYRLERDHSHPNAASYVTRSRHLPRHPDGSSYGSYLTRSIPRPRIERFVSDSTLQPYHYARPAVETRRPRPTTVSHGTNPRFEPHDLYASRGSLEERREGLLYYPDEASAGPYPATQDEYTRIRRPRTYASTGNPTFTTTTAAATSGRSRDFNLDTDLAHDRPAQKRYQPEYYL